jgi:hypothetical protein
MKYWQSRQYYRLRKVVPLLAACLMLVSFVVYSLILKVEDICSSETSVVFERTTLCSIPEDRTLHNHRCENLKPFKLLRLA